MNGDKPEMKEKELKVEQTKACLRSFPDCLIVVELS